MRHVCIVYIVTRIRAYIGMIELMKRYQLYIIIIGMNVFDNLNPVQVINKPCVCTRTMRLSALAALSRDREQ